MLSFKMVKLSLNIVTNFTYEYIHHGDPFDMIQYPLLEPLSLRKREKKKTKGLHLLHFSFVRVQSESVKDPKGIKDGRKKKKEIIYQQ